MSKDFSNLTALAIIQASNALLPLAIFPYVLHAVGADQYAKLVIAESVVMVCLPLVLYSFEIDGVAKAVRLSEQSDLLGLSRLFSGILYIRLGTLLVIALAIAVFGTMIVGQGVLVYLSWLLLPLGYVLQSNWLFQGLERNVPLACFTAVSRGLGVISILYLVRSPSEAKWVPVLVGGFYSLGGLASLAYVVRKFKLDLSRVSFREVCDLIKDGKRIFLGNAAVVLYRDSNVLLLGMLGIHHEGVAAYSIAEKFVKCAQAIMRPLNQLYFPKAIRVSQAAGVPSSSTLQALWKLTMPQIRWLFLGISLFGVIYSVGGERFGITHILENQERILFLSSVMITAVMFGISNFMLGSAGLNYLGEQRFFMRAIAISGIASVAFCASAAIAWQELGAAIAYVGAEALLCVFIVQRYLRKRKPFSLTQL